MHYRVAVFLRHCIACIPQWRWRSKARDSPLLCMSHFATLHKTSFLGTPGFPRSKFDLVLVWQRQKLERKCTMPVERLRGTVAPTEYAEIGTSLRFWATTCRIQSFGRFGWTRCRLRLSSTCSIWEENDQQNKYIVTWLATIVLRSYYESDETRHRQRVSDFDRCHWVWWANTFYGSIVPWKLNIFALLSRQKGENNRQKQNKRSQ